MTILLTPFMSCSAKVPIYVFLSVLFFPGHAGLVVVLLYLMGILTGVLVAWIFKKTTFRGEAVPFRLSWSSRTIGCQARRMSFS